MSETKREPKRTRDKQIHLRLSGDELAEIERRAAVCGKTPTQFVLDSALVGAIVYPTIDLAGAQEIARQLKSIGVLANQMALRINRSDAINANHAIEMIANLQLINQGVDDAWRSLNESRTQAIPRRTR